MLRFPLSSAVLAAFAVLASAPDVRAQTQPLPLPKGTKYSIKIDSSPQQAAIYVNDRTYGIQAYTPSTLKLPKGPYKIILDLPGFKPREVPITVARAQAFSVTLERAARPAVLDLRSASDQNAVAAQIFVDGTAVGTLPNRIEVGAGKHVVEVKKPGFNDFRDNAEVGEGEARTMVIALVAQVKPGSILVTADVQGATVFVDGVQKDTAPAVIGDLTEGPHTVEVRPMSVGKESGPSWKQVVNVIAGQQVKVVAQVLPAAPAAGSVKVLSATAGADVFLDGDAKGPVGSEIKSIPPGSHIIEVRAPGFAPKRQEVQIAAGEMRVLAIDLAAEVTAPKLASLRVISPVPDVEVFVDGALVGKAPIDRSDLAPGKHYVVARKSGYADFKVEVDVQPGKPTEIAADLRASGSLRVISNVAGADVSIDGTPVGKTPLTLNDVAAGDHIVEIKLRDYLDAKETVHVEGGGQKIVSADLTAIQKGPTLGEMERAQREQTSWGALTVDQGKFTVDFGAGYPYFLFARLTAGVAKVKNFGFDVSVELRSSLYDTQVGIRPRMQILAYGPFSLGADFTVMGGGGPTKRNSFTFEVGPIATLSAGQYVKINFKPYLNAWSDRLCPSVSDIKDDDAQSGKMPGMGPLSMGDSRARCHEYSMRADTTYAIPTDRMVMTTAFGQPDPRERFVGARFMLQASLEIALSKGLSLWVLVEGAPGQDQRMQFNTKFNAWFPENDFPLYGRLGITGKF